MHMKTAKKVQKKTVITLGIKKLQDFVQNMMEHKSLVEVTLVRNTLGSDWEFIGVIQTKS